MSGTKKENTQLKHEAINARYNEWIAHTHKGVQMYTDKYIFMRLSEEFFLSPATIERIMFNNTK